MNETGTEISIFINKNEYVLYSNDHLPNITHMAESDIRVKIDDVINQMIKKEISSYYIFHLIMMK